jgi:GNAT superfamily N-acetyltransferase
VNLRFRAFEERDYQRLAEINAAVDPDTSSTAESLRYRDTTLEPRVRMVRIVAETDTDTVVAAGQMMHIWWAYHPRRYLMRLQVDPAWQRRGIGSALFDRLVAEVTAWGADLVRTEAPSLRSAAIAFLEQRGFREWRRRWESSLDVATANVDRLVTADARVLGSGIEITTYADEQTRRGEQLAHDVYTADTLFGSDEPAQAVDAGSESMSFERFAATQLDSPDVLPAGHFLALDGSRIVGLSRLRRDHRRPDVLYQELTGTHPEYRGRGIAQALKLRTIEFARQNGYRQIRTSNDSTNAPMIHINDRIGFERKSPMIIFERRFDGATDSP